jgi:hypothetical protein
MEASKPPIVQKWESVSKAIKNEEKASSLTQKKVVTQKW